MRDDKTTQNLEFLQLVTGNQKRFIPPEVITHIRIAKDLMVDSLHDSIMEMPIVGSD